MSNPTKTVIILIIAFVSAPSGRASAQRAHTPGELCATCHASYSVAGTVYDDSAGVSVSAGTRFALFSSSGAKLTLPASDSAGRIAAAGVPDGSYLPQIGAVRSRSWHSLPAGKECNACHRPGGNASGVRIKTLPRFHTELPEDNDCRRCHHFPASMDLTQLKTAGGLNGSAQPLPVQGSAVIIGGRTYPFDPEAAEIRTSRPDIFAPGYFSFFDAIMETARRNGITIASHWEDSCRTHFIDSVDGTPGDYWHRFSYDAGSGTQNELRNRRQIRWDEIPWQPGAWTQLTTGEDLAGLRRAYGREIRREQQYGRIIPQIQIRINPSVYRGNPPGAGRVTAQRSFSNVKIRPFGHREHGKDSLYRMPFQPGVTTAMDALYSLAESGELTVVGKTFYTRLAGTVQDSYRIQELGFPGTGSAHGSGRQGFVYTTGNGTPQQMVNNAAQTQHIHADIHPIHAPDFMLWRWIELGNPYYEPGDPMSSYEIEADFEAIDKGFRLHHPWPNPASSGVHLSFNVFDPGRYRIEIFDATGRSVSTVFDGAIEDVGVRQLQYDTRGLRAGEYFIRMSKAENIDIVRLIISGR